MKRKQNILQSQAVNVMKLLCFLSLGSVAVFYLFYDNSVWMDQFYFISDKLQMSILLLFLTMNKNKLVSYIARQLYYISLVRLFYTLAIATGLVSSNSLKFDCIALLFVTLIISIYEWNIKHL